MLVVWLIAVALVGAYIAVRVWMTRQECKEPTEMDASYDALRRD